MTVLVNSRSGSTLFSIFPSILTFTFDSIFADILQYWVQNGPFFISRGNQLLNRLHFFLKSRPIKELRLNKQHSPTGTGAWIKMGKSYLFWNIFGALNGLFLGVGFKNCLVGCISIKGSTQVVSWVRVRHYLILGNILLPLKENRILYSNFCYNRVLTEILGLDIFGLRLEPTLKF